MGAVALLVALAVVVTGADSAAVVAPDWTSGAPALTMAATPATAAGSGVVGGSATAGVSRAPEVSSAAAGSGAADPLAAAPRGRWTWPLLPRPPVLARFDPPDVRWGSGHRGVDLGAAVGQEVLAPTDGVVTFRGVVVDRGVLVIETAGGLRTTFEPVDSSLTVGTAVAQGLAVGSVAATPGHCAPATCLHWGVLRDETYLDPLVLVGAVRVILLPLRPP
jgi:murein DD-endopeptidase MepM/ murein hydrolase activator NlpD